MHCRWPIGVWLCVSLAGRLAVGAPPDSQKPAPHAKVAVRTSGRDVAPVVAEIDRQIATALDSAGLIPSPVADDAEFLRRATLDITGRVPTYGAAAAFLDRPDPQKRATLVDELVASREFGVSLANRWREWIAPRDRTNVKGGADRFGAWLADQFNANRPWNELVVELLTTEADMYRAPQAAFVRANSQESAPKPGLLAAATARLFLGVQLGCAECHDHPYAEWKQADFWSTAAFFSRVRKKSKSDATLTEDAPEEASRVGAALAEASIVIPEGSGKASGQAVPARFLGGGRAALSPAGPWRPVLAAWITSGDNPYFARAFVNRLWAQFFGRGLVNPVDDFRTENPPTHPALLDRLAEEFVASGYDVQHLVRCICRSQAYQRTSRPTPQNESDARWYSHMAIKVMTPEVLYDSLHVVVNAQPGGAPAAKKKSGMSRSAPVTLDSRDAFIRFFGASADAERGDSYAYGIPHLLRFMNAPEFNAPAPFIGEQLAAGATPDAMLDMLYLVALARRPTDRERQRMLDFIAGREAEPLAYGGVLWILLSTSEFVMNR